MASKGIENLIKDALANGCQVVRKAHRFEVSKKGQKSITLIICEDGTAYRGDIDMKWSTKTGHRVRVFPVSVF
ncbi:hypothetical protein PTQ46_25790 [Klebsiella michiganensis]|uniref:hypothetical protein n=1 Tax=Klebsiella michiganensis TaxID=1134687 RepID=UPI00287CFE22|nr:hypothetical protein [Klebsiella michiganensis]MDS7843618.1 hypothetical protein [Klebsiella michiganensis]